MKNFLTIILKLILLATVASLIWIFLIIKPSNNRVWEVGHDTLPGVSIDNRTVTIQNFRSAIHDLDKQGDYTYAPRTISADDVERLWFVIEPFSKFSGIAHTYFVFDIKNQQPVAISVEARREKGEKYSTWKGLANQFELIYLWTSESDQAGRRVLVQHEKLYMYPVQTSQAGAQKLFLQMAQETHTLDSKPRFYNTLTSNCTNELAKAVNALKPGTIPLDIALFLPGYSPELLYRLDLIPSDLPFETIKQQYYISDIVRNLPIDVDFSAKLREAI